MRRGLLAWDRQEAPAEDMDARLARMQTEMFDEGWDAVVLHTTFARPAAVSHFTQFVPYWNEAVLLIFPDGPPAIHAALSKRVHGWMREVSHLGEVNSAPKVGLGAASMLSERLPMGAKVGVVDLDSLPLGVIEPLAEALGADSLEDAGEAFRRIRHPADGIELTLAGRAGEIAGGALDAVPKDASDGPALVSAIDDAARSAGAEESLIAVAPDLGVGSLPYRLEGPVTLGETFSVRISLAYKGVWVRAERCFARGGPPAVWQVADEWLAEVLPTIGNEGKVTTALAAPPGRIADWWIEACVSSTPLTVIAGSEDGSALDLPPGSVAVLGIRMETVAGPWLRTLALLTGGAGVAARTLP